MRVLVTGAAGFVGRHLVARLVDDHDVIAVVHRPQDHDLDTSKTIVADLSTSSFVTRLPRDVDVIVHLAQAYRAFPEHAAEILAVNSVSTQRMAEHARASGIRRFVLASSGSVYGPSDRPLRETDDPRPTSFHPTTKLMAEELLSFYADSIETLVLRVFAPYGPGQADRLIPRLIAAVQTGSDISLSHGGEPRLQPLYVGDLVELLVQAISSEVTGTYNIAGPDVFTIGELANLVGEIVGHRPLFAQLDREERGDFVADTSAVHSAFTIPRLVSADDGLRRTIASAGPR